jgi:hypothetical protein
MSYGPAIDRPRRELVLVLVEEFLRQMDMYHQVGRELSDDEATERASAAFVAELTDVEAAQGEQWLEEHYLAAVRAAMDQTPLHWAWAPAAGTA